jgi:hypothetical protein
VYEAIWAVTPGEMPAARLLFAIRSVPGRLAGRPELAAPGEEPLLRQMLARGFSLLAEDPGREVVAGAIGQMWRLRGGRVVRVEDGAAFAAFAEPGFAKAATSLRVDPEGAGTRLETETRVVTTDAASRRAFGRYWAVIGRGSDLVRLSWLRAIARRAERAAP